MTGRFRAMVARSSGAARAVRSPVLAAILASGLTAVLLGGPPEVHTVETVRIRELVPGTTKVIRETVFVCKGQVGVTAKNHTEDATARSGDAGTANGSGGADVNQAGAARSGSIDLGQDIDVDAACSTVQVTATNHVQDVEAETGDAEVVNQIAATPEPSPTPSGPSGAVGPLGAPEPTPLPSVSPSPTPLSVVESPPAT